MLSLRYCRIMFQGLLFDYADEILNNTPPFVYRVHVCVYYTESNIEIVQYTF